MKREECQVVGEELEMEGERKEMRKKIDYKRKEGKEKSIIRGKRGGRG